MAVSDLRIINAGSDGFIGLMLGMYGRMYGTGIQVPGPVDGMTYGGGISTCMKLLDGSLQGLMVSGMKELIETGNASGGKDGIGSSGVSYDGEVTDELIHGIETGFENLEAFLGRCRNERKCFVAYSVAPCDNLYQSVLLKFRDCLKELGIYDRCVFIGKRHSRDVKDDSGYSADFQVWQGTFGKRYHTVNTDNRSLAFSQFMQILKSLDA